MVPNTAQEVGRVPNAAQERRRAPNAVQENMDIRPTTSPSKATARIVQLLTGRTAQAAKLV